MCALITFRTGPDPETIDAVFRGSALYREKWNLEDYRTSTIDAGITACNGVFHKSKMETPKNRVAELEQLLSAEKDNVMNVNQFLTLVKKYTEVQELTAEIIREFVEKIYVYQAEKIDDYRVQKIPKLNSLWPILL